jgi:epoxide hydrolase-like predicted phosphatase
LTSVLLLDVMDTLVHDPFRDIPGFFGLSFEGLFEVVHPTAWVEFEKGLITQDEFLTNFFADGRVYDHVGMLDLMVSGYRWVDGMPELLAQLKDAGISMHTLSNYPVWWQTIETKLEVSEFVSWSFVSCEHGVRKPDPQAYLIAAKAAGVAPTSCVFVDDRGSNCRAAAEVGMTSVKFESASQLLAELRAIGVL